MAATKTPTRTLHLRITSPDLTTRQAMPTDFGAQDKQRILYPGTPQNDGTITFALTVSVVRHASRRLRALSWSLCPWHSHRTLSLSERAAGRSRARCLVPAFQGALSCS